MSDRNNASTGDTHNSTYELFVLALSLLSLLNMILIGFLQNSEAKQIIYRVDIIISLVLLVDFFIRLGRTEQKLTYLRLGWMDFLGSLPFPALRLFRLFRVIRIIRRIRRTSTRELLRISLEQRAESALFIGIFLSFVLLMLSAILIIPAEQYAPDANIHTAEDAVWWAFVTMATVGYGDFYPVTNNGRIIAMVLMAFGIGLFSVITGFLAKSFFTPQSTEKTVTQEMLKHELAELRTIIETQSDAPPQNSKK